MCFDPHDHPPIPEIAGGAYVHRGFELTRRSSYRAGGAWAPLADGRNGPSPGRKRHSRAGAHARGPGPWVSYARCRREGQGHRGPPDRTGLWQPAAMRPRLVSRRLAHLRAPVVDSRRTGFGPGLPSGSNSAGRVSASQAKRHQPSRSSSPPLDARSRAKQSPF